MITGAVVCSYWGQSLTKSVLTNGSWLCFGDAESPSPDYLAKKNQVIEEEFDRSRACKGRVILQ